MPFVVVLLFFIGLIIFLLTMLKIGLFSYITDFFIREDSDLDIDKKRKEYINETYNQSLSSFKSAKYS